MVKRKTISWWKNELNIPTKKGVEDKIRNIIKLSELNKPFSDEDTKFLLIILSHHHHFKQKIGCGLKYLQPQRNESWNGPTIGIWIIRLDDTKTDISWVTALKPDGKPSCKEDVSSAARFEIYEQIHEFHAIGECNLCDLCKKQMVRNNELHVDHIDPFENIFNKFLQINKLSYEDIITKDVENRIESQFTNREIAEDWKKFHKENAILRLTHKICNLRRKTNITSIRC